MISFDDVVLSLFPHLTTHLKHLKNDPLSELFPYDALIAVCAVTYCRYTVHYTGESKVSRLFWSVVLGYLAYNRFDYWIQAYVHIVSFGAFIYDKASGYYAAKVIHFQKYHSFHIQYEDSYLKLDLLTPRFVPRHPKVVWTNYRNRHKC